MLGKVGVLAGEHRLVLGREVEETGQQDVRVHFYEEFGVGVDEDVFARQHFGEDWSLQTTLQVLLGVAHVEPFAARVAAETVRVLLLALAFGHRAVVERQLFSVADGFLREHADRVVVVRDHRHSPAVRNARMRKPRAVVASKSRIDH